MARDKTTSKLETVFSWLGGLLAVLGLIFVVGHINENWDQISRVDLPASSLFLFGLLAVGYGAINLILARAWWLILGTLNVAVSWRWAIRIYGRSQVAKYLPGNIFHLAGRQVLSQAAGLPAGPVLKSTVLELALTGLAGLSLSMLALPALLKQSSPLLGLLPWLLISLMILIGAGLWRGRKMAGAYVWQTVFLTLSGLIFVAVLTAVHHQPLHPETIPILIGAYVAAWFAGFVTPGAPAGIGIREAVLTLLLCQTVAEADLLLAVIISRVVTMLGDLLYFAFTTLMNSDRPMHNDSIG